MICEVMKVIGWGDSVHCRPTGQMRELPDLPPGIGPGRSAFYRLVGGDIGVHSGGHEVLAVREAAADVDTIRGNLQQRPFRGGA